MLFNKLVVTCVYTRYSQTCMQAMRIMMQPQLTMESSCKYSQGLTNNNCRKSCHDTDNKFLLLQHKFIRITKCHSGENSIKRSTTRVPTHHCNIWKVEIYSRNLLHKKNKFLPLIMKTAAMLVIFILGTCFYMSTAAPSRHTEVYNQVDKVADVDPCLLCNLLVNHLTYCEDHLYYRYIITLQTVYYMHVIFWRIQLASPPGPSQFLYTYTCPHGRLLYSSLLCGPRVYVLKKLGAWVQLRLRHTTVSY